LSAFTAPLLERAIGLICLPQTERHSHYVHARVADQFDAPIHAGHRAYGEAMTKAGVIRGGAELKPPALGGGVRFKNGKPAKMDGPFAETKEQLGGYCIVETIRCRRRSTGRRRCRA
jgi:hypothetical protein